MISVMNTCLKEQNLKFQMFIQDIDEVFKDGVEYWPKIDDESLMKFDEKSSLNYFSKGFLKDYLKHYWAISVYV